jgi:hypothetical protein
MDLLVRKATEEFLPRNSKRHATDWAKCHQGQDPKLFVSSLGHCPRMACFSAVQHLPDHPFHREITHPFDLYTLGNMYAGSKAEDWTEEILRDACGDDLQMQVDVSDGVWIDPQR